MRIFSVKNNGHLTIYKSDDNYRRTEEFLTCGDTNFKILSSKIKESFDPNLILNPGKNVRRYLMQQILKKTSLKIQKLILQKRF